MQERKKDKEITTAQQHVLLPSRVLSLHASKRKSSSEEDEDDYSSNGASDSQSLSSDELCWEEMELKDGGRHCLFHKKNCRGCKYQLKAIDKLKQLKKASKKYRRQIAGLQ